MTVMTSIAPAPDIACCPWGGVTDAHRASWNTFGYAVFRAVYSPAEIAVFAQALTRVLDREVGPFDPRGRSQRLVPLATYDPATFLAPLDDDRLNQIVDALLGPRALFGGGNDGNRFIGDTPWHIDGGGLGGPVLLKATLYLEPVKAEVGGLAVLPGSHHPDYFHALYQRFYVERSLDLHAHDLPGIHWLESEPGDVLVFNQRLWHASWGGWAGRHQFAYSFAQFPLATGDETWLAGYWFRLNQRHQKRLFNPDWLIDAPTVRRQRLEKVASMGL